MAKITKLTPKQREALGKIRSKLIYHKDLILKGTFVSIDPSCVSQNGSKPAYAIYVKGEFVEQGIIDVPYKPQLYLRLQMIRKVVMKDLAPHVDLCIIEETPVVALRSAKNAAATGRSYMNATSIASLKKASGAIISAFDCPVIDMPAHIWHRVANTLGLTITKEDDADARLIGHAAIYLISTTDDII